MPTKAKENTGIVYICFGTVHQQLAIRSILHLRNVGYIGPVRVLTNIPNWDEETLRCEIVLVEDKGEGFGTRYYKTRINAYGYETTLFLDADTLPISSLNKLWSELRFSDICMAMDRHPNVGDLIAKSATSGAAWKGWGEHPYSPQQRLLEYDYMKGLGLMQSPFHNSGVLLFRRSAATDKLFELWSEEWERFRDADQLALVRALARANLRVHTLSPVWNARLSQYGTLENALLSGVHILHLRPGNDIPETEVMKLLLDGRRAKFVRFIVIRAGKLKSTIKDFLREQKKL